MRFTIPTTSAILILAASAGGCADPTGPAAGRPMSISFTTAASSGASMSRSAEPGTFWSISATTGTDELVIDQVQVVVARMELERAGAVCGENETAAGDDEVNHEDDCEELELAPSVIDLPVDAAVVSKLTVTIPEGSYSSLEAKLRPVRADNDRGRGSSAFLTANPDLAGVSVRVTGTFNGKPFTYTGVPRVKLEREFDPPLAVGADPVNLTVQVDVSNWFRSQGALIDPATANAGGPNAEKVANNIKSSFRAFRDDDRNGHDDDDDRRLGRS